jgi:glutamyl-tRNA synthetase
MPRGTSPPLAEFRILSPVIAVSVRARFAPSPTGYLHVGGARTALYNYLFARRCGGVFVLRIEDTDKLRSTDENTRQILDAMRWLGLDWDEGPFLQSDGLVRHREQAHRLLDEGEAYRCFCSAEPAERPADDGAESAEPPRYMYDRKCRALVPAEAAARASAGEPFAIRFRVPDGETAFDDLVHERTSFRNDEIEDFVLLRSDGFPTYHLSCVCDDIEMRITHVIRGDDHLSNTPKQVLLHLALGATPPIFAHLPLILGPDKKRLSKRHGATSVLAYRDEGIMAAAMVNFLGLLGWSPGGDREVMTLDEMAAEFSFEGVGKSGAIFDVGKLLWMSGEHMSRTPAADLLPLIEPALGRAALWPPAGGVDEAARRRVEAIIDLAKVRRQTLIQLGQDVVRYLSDDVAIEDDAAAKHLVGDDLKARLAALREALAAATDWSPPALETAVREAAARLGVGAAKLIHPARVAVLGVAVSPGVFEVLTAVGRESTLKRIERLEQRL